MRSPSSFSIFSIASAVKGSPTSFQRKVLWQPGQRQGQLERLIANVTSLGNSWKTISVFTYLSITNLGLKLCAHYSTQYAHPINENIKLLELRIRRPPTFSRLRT